MEGFAREEKSDSGKKTGKVREVPLNPELVQTLTSAY